MLIATLLILVIIKDYNKHYYKFNSNARVCAEVYKMFILQQLNY